LVPSTPAQMFALVADLEGYPDVVPGVSKGQVLERGDDDVIGGVGMHRGGSREAFTARNTARHPERRGLEGGAGPFQTLAGLGSFEDIAGRGCNVSLKMQFEFSKPLLALLLSRTFEKSCSDLVDAFVARARDVYGQS